MRLATILAPEPWCGIPDTSATNPKQCPLDLPCASFSPWDFMILSPYPVCPGVPAWPYDPGQTPLSKPSLTELVALSTILK